MNSKPGCFEKKMNENITMRLVKEFMKTRNLFFVKIPIYIFQNTFSVLDILQDIAEYIRLWSILLTYLITPWEYDEEKPTSYIGYKYILFILLTGYNNQFRKYEH